MNAAQNRQLADLEQNTRHFSSVSYVCTGRRRVACSCGWSTTLHNRNAMAMQSKIHKAIRTHIEERIQSALRPFSQYEAKQIAWG
jgi:hypothetical protein